MVVINIDRKEIVFFGIFVFVFLIIGFSVAFGGTAPSEMGHSFEELEGVQKLISGSCAVGSSIRVINPDGTVLCETDDGSPSQSVSGSLVGGGFNRDIKDEFSTTKSCGNVWGAGSCASNRFFCDAGTTKRLTGSNTDSSLDEDYYVCIQD